MATLWDLSFDSGDTYPPTGWSEAGTTANIGPSATQFNSGDQSLRVVAASSQSEWITNNITDAKSHVMRCYMYIATAPSGTVSWYQLDHVTGNIFCRLTAARVARITINTTNVDGPTLALNTWYRWDVKFDTTGANVLVDWQIDGAVKTQASLAQTSANMTAAYLGLLTGSTHDIYFDDFMATDNAADYPIGAVIPPPTSFDPMGLSGMIGL